ncbi:PspC domain-containing protein [Isoptericola aurantiacus]|uniref:PspC domain-containing protein n=1 Tax=Isoptericola aurantiacus TaxID=3377839 RepID=UPI00383B00AF
MTTNDTPPPDGPDAAGDGAASSGAPAAGDAGQAPPRRPAGDGFFDSVRRAGVARSEDRWVGGVAAGVAERFRLDPLLVRGLLILSFFVTGAGLVLYGVAWALLPERSDGRIHLQEAIRGSFDVAILGAGLAIVLGIGAGGGFWPWWGGPAEWVATLLWIAFWVAVVWLIVKLVRSRRGRPGPDAGAPYAGAPEHRPDAAPSSTTTSAAGGFTPAPRVHYAAPAAGPYAAPSPAGATAPLPSATSPAAPTAPSGHGAPSAPAGPPVPPPPPPPRRTAGGGTVGAVLGLTLLIGAGLLAADVALGITWPLWPLWLGLTVAVLGAAIIVTGLRGLRGGWLTALAVLALVGTAITWPFADRQSDWPFDDWAWDDGAQVTTMSGTVLSSGQVTPRSTASAEAGVRVQFGEARVDLTELDLTDVSPGDPVVVPIDMTAGSTVVTVPADTAVQADVDVSAGTFTWDVGGEYRRVDGFSGGPATYRTDEVDEDGGAVLLLDVDTRAGQFVIEEDR